MHKLIVVAVMVGTSSWLGGCGESAFRWENPAVAEEVWASHKDECRRQARAKAEREFVTIDQADPGAQFGRQSTLRGNLARYDAGVRREDLFVACMRDRGYRSVKTEPDS